MLKVILSALLSDSAPSRPETFMPYVPQVRHIDRIRRLIEGRMPERGGDATRLASSYWRSLEQYHLDPGLTDGSAHSDRAGTTRRTTTGRIGFTGLRRVSFASA